MSARIVLLKVGATFEHLAARRGDYDAWFREGLGVGDDLDVIRVAEGEPLPARRYDGVVVTGSSAMVTDCAAWSVAAGDFLRDAIAHGSALLGVCYGHQLLADALGGAVHWNPNGRQIGTIAATLTEEGRGDLLLGGLGDALVVQTSHRQSVRALPPAAVHLAASPRDAHHAFRVGERAWGVQFHPEFDADVTRAYVRERSAAIRDEGDDPDALHDAVRESDHGRRILRRFAAIVRG